MVNQYEDDGYEEDHVEVDKRLEQQELEDFENIIEEVEYL